MNNLVALDLTPQSCQQFARFVEVADDKLDYLGAFLDVNYYEHTGTQTLARRLIERAVAEI